MRQLIPTNTKLKPENLDMLIKSAIPRREKELKKVRYGNPDMALWLMSELEHLRKLRDNNLNGTANEPHPDLISNTE